MLHNDKDNNFDAVRDDILSSNIDCIVVQRMCGKDDNNIDEVVRGKNIDDGQSYILKDGNIQRAGSIIISGYTGEKLPFQIAANAAPDDADDVRRFIENEVVPLMGVYAKQLSSTSSDVALKNLLTEIYRKRYGYRALFEFSMSLDITYRKDNALRCAGFGIGYYTGIVLNNETQLAHENAVLHNNTSYSDAFHRVDLDDERNANFIDNIIKRNSTFDVAVQPGDRIACYTNISFHLEVEAEGRRFEESDVVVFGNQELPANEARIVKYRTYFPATNPENKEDYDSRMVGISHIPTPELQDKLKKQVFAREKEILAEKLNHVQNEKIKSSVRNILDAIEKAEKTEDLTQLTSHLAACHRVIADHIEIEREKNTNYIGGILDRARKNLEDFMLRAKDASGSYSTTLNVIGGLMIACGLIVAAVGGVMLLGSLGLVSTGALAIPGAVGVSVGAGMLGGGLTLFAAGAIACGYGRHKGISKAEDTLGKELAKEMSAIKPQI